jgi:hypothetical protein
MSAIRRTAVLVAILALVPWNANAADEEEERQPVQLNLNQSPFGIDLAPNENQASPFSLDNYVPGPKATPTPEVVKPPKPVDWRTVSVVTGVAVVVAFVLWMYFRWLYFDNIFGRTYHFAVPPANLRLGGAYGGGHGAVVRIRRP